MQFPHEELFPLKSSKPPKMLQLFDESPSSRIPSTRAIERFIFREMFQKELTPSDVGKLNRLVIPKKYATRYFPQVRTDAVEEILLEFRDRLNRSWVFRYCYWSSSQSYVFTKGWNKFVKKIDLRAKDIVIFYCCKKNEALIRKSFFMIDIVRCVRSIDSVEADNPVEGAEETEKSDEKETKLKEFKDMDESGEIKEIRLFGVWIR